MRWRSRDRVGRQALGLLVMVGGGVLVAMVVPVWLWSGLVGAAVVWLGMSLWRT